MLRFLFRAIGLLVLAGAFAAVIVDGTRSIAASGPVFTPLGEAFAAVAPTSVAALETAAGQIHPLLRDPGLLLLLKMPLWLLGGVIGGLLLVLTRPRRPTIGFSSRAG